MASVGQQGSETGRPAVVRGGCERDLSVFLAYQASDAGVRDQTALTAASKKLATYARDCGRRVVGPTATVFYHLGRSVRRAPGLWLLRQPLTEAQLSGQPGAHSQSVYLNGGCSRPVSATFVVEPVGAWRGWEHKRGPFV